MYYTTCYIPLTDISKLASLRETAPCVNVLLDTLAKCEPKTGSTHVRYDLSQELLTKELSKALDTFLNPFDNELASQVSLECKQELELLWMSPLFE